MNIYSRARTFMNIAIDNSLRKKTSACYHVRTRLLGVHRDGIAREHRYTTTYLQRRSRLYRPWNRRVTDIASHAGGVPPVQKTRVTERKDGGSAGTHRCLRALTAHSVETRLESFLFCFLKSPPGRADLRHTGSCHAALVYNTRFVLPPASPLVDQWPAAALQQRRVDGPHLPHQRRVALHVRQVRLGTLLVSVVRIVYTLVSNIMVRSLLSLFVSYVCSTSM